MRSSTDRLPLRRGGQFAAALPILALLLAACDAPAPDQADPRIETRMAETETTSTNSANSADAVQDEDARLMAFFEAAFDEFLAHNPMFQTHLGIKTDYDRLNDLTDAGHAAQIDRARANLARLRGEFDFEALGEQARVSYRLFERNLENQIAASAWRHHGYAVTQLGAATTAQPTFLINSHRVSSVEDAQAYVSRLRELGRVMHEVAENLEIRAARGVLPPAFVFPKVIGDTRGMLTGYPFEDSENHNTLYADFARKTGALEIDEETRAALLAQAREAMTGPMLEGYGRILATMEALAQQAETIHGVWHLPDGEAYYNFAIATQTTLDGMTAHEIHEIGLAEVARIHGEMKEIIARIGFEGSLQDFFHYVDTDAKFAYPRTEEGKAEMLADATAMIEAINEVAGEWFSLLPGAAVEVRAVESWRANTAPVAFYNGPAPDGSRPGYYYINVEGSGGLARHMMEAVTYHEAVPGHHFQVALAQELRGLPRFRRFGGETAYAEGWALYAELLAKEMGFYQDPYADFGRLAAEIWRAARLVVDTGIHAKRWTREEAVDYMLANTPLSEDVVRMEIDRYFVMPGQALAYKMGMLKIQQLRARAEETLGERFDVRDFHTEVLRHGSVPLPVLEELIDNWIARQGG